MGSFATSNPTGSSDVTGSGTANQLAVWASTSSLGIGTIPFTSSATGYTIGTGSAIAAAVLTINSTTQGFGLPRLSTPQRALMAGLEAGVLLFNTTQDTLNVYTDGGGTPAWAGVITTATMPATFVVGDILYASSTSLLSRLADVDLGSVLVSGGVGAAPAWSAAPSFGTSITSPIVYTPSIISSTVAATALSIITTTTGALSLDTGTSGSINIGTNANAKVITIGNVTGATAVNVNSGTATCTWTTTNGVWSLITGTGTINIGSDSAAKTILIGAGASANAISLGNSTGNTVINLNAGTGGVNVGTNAIAHAITIGNVTGSTAVLINAGGGTCTWTTTNGAWQLITGTGVINFSADAAATTINFATGAAVKTLNILSGSAGKIGFFGATAIVRVTTAGAGATFVANASANIVYDESTFDGYKINQVVKALRNYGILT